MPTREEIRASHERVIDVAVGNVRDALRQMAGLDGGPAHAVHLMTFAQKPEMDLLLVIGTREQCTRMADWIDKSPEFWNGASPSEGN